MMISGIETWTAWADARLSSNASGRKGPCVADTRGALGTTLLLTLCLGAEGSTQASAGDATCGGLVVRPIATGVAPEADHASRVAYTPNGDRFVIAHLLTRNLVVFDAGTLTATMTIPLTGSPQDLAICPDGIHAVTANIEEDSCSIVDLALGVETAVIPLGDQPAIVRVSRNGSQAVVGNLGDQTLSVIDLASATEIQRFSGAGFWSIEGSAPLVGLHWLTVSALEFVDEHTVVMSNFQQNRIDWFDVDLGLVTALPCDPAPFGIALTPDCKKAVVSHLSGSGAGKVSVVDLSQRQITNVVQTPANLLGPICIDPGGNTAVASGFYFAFPNTVSTCVVVGVNGGWTMLGDTGFASDLLSTRDGQYALAVCLRGVLISYASKSVVANVNNVITAGLGAVSPTDPRALLVGGTYGAEFESFVSVETSVPGGPLGPKTPTGPIPEADHSWRVAASPDGRQAVTVNLLSDNASIVDLASGTVTAVVPTGSRPIAVGIAPSGAKAVVGAQLSSSATVIDLATAQATQVPISKGACQVAIAPDSHWAYVAVQDSSCGVWRIDLSSLTPSGPMLTTGTMGVFLVPNAMYSGIALSHDGSTLVTCDLDSSQLSVIDTALWSVVQTVPLSGQPLLAVFSANDRKLYVGSWTRLFELRRIGPAWQQTRMIDPLGPCIALALSPDESDLYVGTEGNGVQAIDTSTFSLAASVSLPGYLNGLAVSASGADLLAAAIGMGDIPQSGGFTRIDTSTLQVVEHVVRDVPDYDLVSVPEAGFILMTSPWEQGLVQVHLPVSTGIYCSASTTSIPGCAALLSTDGCPSLSNPSAFLIRSGSVPGGGGAAIAYFGLDGPAAIPFGTQGGVLCVQSPVHRSSPLFGTGTLGACDGSFVVTLADLLVPNPNTIQAGTTVHAALWFRDTASPDGFGLSNGAWFQVVQ
jgi:DNA-binding beta-propeller fold protein YncE